MIEIIEAFLNNWNWLITLILIVVAVTVRAYTFLGERSRWKAEAERQRKEWEARNSFETHRVRAAQDKVIRAVNQNGF